MKYNKYTNIDILIIPSNLNELSKVERFCQKISKKATLSDEKSDNLSIVLTELVNNAMIHGNNLISGKKVFIKACLYEDRLEVFIRDQGKGFEPNKIANPTNPENLWKESGRGIYLVQNLIDSVEYISTENGMGIKITEFIN